MPVQKLNKKENKKNTIKPNPDQRTCLKWSCNFDNEAQRVRAEKHFQRAQGLPAKWIRTCTGGVKLRNN
jgi:hypothetical protein